MVLIPRPIDPREIRKMRKELGITQEELAKKAGVTQAYIAKLESGKVDPRLSTFNRILQALLECKKAQLRARDVMSSPVISVKPYDTVEKVIRIMSEHNISQIPVMAGNKVVGSVTEKSLVRRSLEYEDIYDRKIIEVIKYLLEDNQAVLVQDRSGKIIGIITRVDIFRIGKGHE